MRIFNHLSKNDELVEVNDELRMWNHDSQAAYFLSDTFKNQRQCLCRDVLPKRLKKLLKTLPRSNGEILHLDDVYRINAVFYEQIQKIALSSKQ
jgi:hypothetical protein